MKTSDRRHWLVLAAPEGPDPGGVDKLRRLLDRHGLVAGRTDSLLRARDGSLPLIGGEETPVESAWLGPGAHTPYFQVHGISANLAQCRLLFDVAVTARLLIGVEPGPPHAVICGGVLDADDLPPGLDMYCLVDSAEELHACLHGGDEAWHYDRPN
ncbi:hypothetical protein [Corynebacterium comes]|uniref:Uncharacterized protein n=1 Tax=Corynebacterium comes TaxID=2675218 RepID=A0A6B8VM02_9CORY|nr:hypothetical protein [Corynebacterium comes]QGU05063.1 hypothetical protein CETAM_09045 [Corynebacterium comes]